MESLNYEQLINNNGKYNLALVIGHSGTGKSSLINHLIGKEVATVSDVCAGTQNTTGYKLTDKLVLVDTRGTNEIGNAEESWTNVLRLVHNLAPDIIIWCVDASRRDELDSQLIIFEKLLSEVFKRTRLDSKVCILANKMDLIEPPGIEYLPKNWPNLRTEKGKNINQRMNQINKLFLQLCNAELRVLEPTCLEWYDGAEPWNLDGIKHCLLDDFSTESAQILRDLGLTPKLFKKIIAIQAYAIRKDIAKDSQQPELQQKKQEWLFEYGQKVNFGPIELDCTIFKHLPKDPLKRQVVLQNLLLFTPYVPLSASNKETIKYDPKRFTEIMSETLSENCGFTSKEINSFLEEFGAFKDELQDSWFSLTNLALVAIATLSGGLLMWWYAPMIGGIIGSALFGLKGAAATSAGLAWLGLGSIAAGGFGMFGGTVVLVGTAGLLAGATSSVAIAYTASTINPFTATMDAAKILQSFRLLLKLCKTEPKRKQQILELECFFARTIHNLTVELKAEKENRKNLESSIEIYTKALSIMTRERRENKVYFYREANQVS